jgi:hypothetical protein
MQKMFYLFFSSLIFTSVLSQPPSANDLHQTSAAAKAKSEMDDLCRRLSEIKRLPFKGESIDDEIYNQFLKQGKAAIPCLINSITNATKMRDPRSAPSYEDFRVGDAAFFILLKITNVPFEQMLPYQVKARLKEEGVYAYFRYVEKTANRKALQDRWKAWLKENPSI